MYVSMSIIALIYVQFMYIFHVFHTYMHVHMYVYLPQSISLSHWLTVFKVRYRAERGTIFDLRCMLRHYG